MGKQIAGPKHAEALKSALQIAGLLEELEAIRQDKTTKLATIKEQMAAVKASYAEASADIEGQIMALTRSVNAAVDDKQLDLFGVVTRMAGPADQRVVEMPPRRAEQEAR